MVRCPYCRSPIPKGDSFCGMCGRRTSPNGTTLPGGNGNIPDSSNLIVHILLIILLAITLFIALYMVNVFTATKLVIAEKPIPGQSVQVIGNNFPANQIVIVTIDGQPLTQDDTSETSTKIRGTPVTVGADGKLTIEIQIHTYWKVGSTHYLKAYRQEGTEITSHKVTVQSDKEEAAPNTPYTPFTPIPSPTPPPIPSPTPPPIPLPTPPPTPAPSPTPPPTPTPSPTPTPTPSPTPTPTPTPTPSPTTPPAT